MNLRKIGVLSLFSFCLVCFSFNPSFSQEKRKPVVIPGKKFLPLRVLSRPLSHIYQEPKEDSTIVEENVPAFQNYYVYTRPEVDLKDTANEGWYEVGTDKRGTVVGWMKAEDVMEWRQTMTLAYMHPSGRKPVLMFNDINALRSLVMADSSEARQKMVREYYASIESKNIPEDFPVTAVEPKDAVDINEKFYLMPILEYSPIMLAEREGRIMKIASAPKSGRGEAKLNTDVATRATEENTKEIKSTQSEDVAMDKTLAGSLKVTMGSKNLKEVSTDIANEDANIENVTMEIDKDKSQKKTAVHKSEMKKTKETAKDFTTAADHNNPEAMFDQKLNGFFRENQEVLKNFQMDVVYVVDMTASMQKHIDATLKVIESITTKVVQNKELDNSVRFGLWGYRDSMEIPNIEFNTKNYTPELQDVEGFKKTLATVKVAKVGSEDYEEDLFSGLDQAMRNTQWTENAARIIVLLGDAPSHEPGHKWNASGKSAETLRSFADDNKLSIFAFHIKDPRAENYWNKAEKQFKSLSTNRGMKEPMYHSAFSTDLDAFTRVSKLVADGLVDIVKSAKEGTAPEISALKDSGEDFSDEELEVVEKIQQMGYAALVDWVGKEKGVEAPRDIVAWVIDKDLIDPTIDSLDVRVLVSKNQLDSLRTVLQELMTAGRKNAISGDKFFDALQSIPAVASRCGDQIKAAVSIAETGLFPEFLTDLPYESRIMSMSNDLWASWSQDQQESFLNDVESKIKLYTAIHDSPKGWVALNQDDEPGEHVYVLSLYDLP